MPPNDLNGWERWRGEINSQVDDHETDLKALWAFKEEASREITILKTKLVIFSAVAAALGAMLPGAIAGFFNH